MRRNIPSLILLFALLILSGLAISANFTFAALFRGYYVPTFSSDPKTAQLEALIFVGGVVAILFLTIGTGAGLAFAFHYLTKIQVAHSALETPAEQEALSKPKAPSKPVPKAAAEVPHVPLSDTRSVVVFWVVVIAVLGIFLVPRYWGQSPGYVPNLLATSVIPTRAAPPPAVSAATPAPGGGGSGIEVLQAEFEALPKGDATAGQAVFTSAGCVACHSLEPGVKIVGPSQAGLATRAATQKPGYSAELYLYESITQPNAYLVEGFQPDLMLKTFKETLMPQDLADVIAFLLTLK